MKLEAEEQMMGSLISVAQENDLLELKDRNAEWLGEKTLK